MTTESLAPGRAAAPRLLATSPRAGGGSALEAHLAVHGPLSLPTGDDPAWRSALAAAVADSGLMGRGGAAFPVGRKWASVGRGRRRPLVVVNAMEGEPASLKDSALLQWSPHLVLDGAEVAASMIGAAEIVVCLPERRSAAVAAVTRAVTERSRSRRGLPVSLRHPPDGYVTGEESALVGWVERGQALPVLRLDKSVPLTVGRRAALVHNAETLAQVGLVARHGADWFRQRGTAEAPGTTLVTVSGVGPDPVLLEVELGRPVADILERAGCAHPLSAALVGGYGGAWLAAADLSTPYAPGPLARVGAVAGVGVVVALPTTSCGMAETARLVRYLAGESAGQCGPCVFGLPAVADDLDRLAGGTGGPGTVDRLEGRLAQIDGRGACRHPDGAVRLVRSALTVFADDVRAHAGGRPCPGVGSPTVLTPPAGRGWPS